MGIKVIKLFLRKNYWGEENILDLDSGGKYLVFFFELILWNCNYKWFRWWKFW